MNRCPALVLIASVLMSLTTAAQAQSVWRCSEGGRVLYQGEPCRGGRAVEPPTPRPAQDEAEAQRIASRQVQLAEQLSAERRQRDAQPVALAAGIPYTKNELSPSKKPRLKTKHPPQRDADAQTWRATRPASRHKPG
jgi:protein-disulfide isomerase